MFRIRPEAIIVSKDAPEVINGYWKCDQCGRRIQAGLSKGDHELISHRFGLASRIR